MISVRHQSGATLIEVLVTMVVVSLGLLGTAGLVLASAKFQQTSTYRGEAMQQGLFIIEKMRGNNSVLTAANQAAAAATPLTAYLAEDGYEAADDEVDDPACGLSAQPACNAGQAAQKDLREWRLSLAQTLPGGRGSIFSVDGAGGATEPNARRVVVMWREKSELTTDTEANLGVNLQDNNCPPPRVDGIRCLNFWVTP